MKNTGISEITSEGSIIKTFCQIQSSVLFLLKFIYLFILLMFIQLLNLCILYGFIFYTNSLYLCYGQ